MVRILRIINLISVGGACTVVFSVLVFGFRPCLIIQTILSQPSITEELKENFREFAQPDDKEPPLVVQARLFALRIDPPPPIKTILQPPKDNSGPSITADPPVPPIIPAEIKLIATASYKDYPEKSLALLNLVSGGYKWVRQGEIIDQSTVGEIKDGKIILYQNGKKEKKLFVPKPQGSLKPLLKN